MTDATDPADEPGEVEVDVTDGAAFELQELEIDADERPRRFLVEGLVREIDEGLLGPMSGRPITPVAVRFEVHDRSDGPCTPSERTFRTWHAADEPLTAAVVRGLAAVEGVEPSELDPLYYSIDPDALEALCEAPAGNGSGVVTVAFTACSHRVRVRSDGSVAIRVAAERE